MFSDNKILYLDFHLHSNDFILTIHVNITDKECQNKDNVYQLQGVPDTGAEEWNTRGLPGALAKSEKLQKATCLE